MPIADSQGVGIYYRDEGSGPAVLLLHGHTLDGSIFDDVLPGLLEEGYRVLRPDLRGHGRSDRPPQGYHFSHHAQDMAAVMDDAGVKRAVVGGFSLGGGIALEMVITMPEKVRALGLFSPVLPDRPFEEAFMNNLREVARTARREGIRKAMEGPWMESPLFEASFRRPDVLEKTRRIVTAFPGAEYLAEVRDKMTRDWKLPDRLGEIRCPTTVMVGGEEMAGFRAFAEETAGGIPDAGFEVIADAGHLWPLEEPDRLRLALLALLQSAS